MKSMIFAALMAASNPSPFIIPTDDGIFVVQTATVRSYENVHGAIQVDALVDLSTPAGVSRTRVGVSGCSDGKGSISRVSDDGSPLAEPRAWVVGGPKVFDVLAASICEAASALQPEAPISKPAGRMA